VAFGIQAENCFEMSDSIGGRFSLWSNIGLSIALQIGMNRFTELLAGAHAMDNHFRTEPTRKNIPVLMALISLWYRNFWGAQSYAILPYSQRLALLPAFLQQLEMESLGKSVLKNGQPSPHQTGGVIWGGIGTNGQHAFHQLIHQGTLLIPADFITIEKSALDATLSPELQAHQTHQHEVLLKHARAQMQALVQGKTREEAEAELRKAGHSKEAIALLAPHKMIPGNRPCVEISLNKLNPFNLGQLLAAYEHKVFALSVFLNINPFDQFGVELGKALAEA
jgi:glucose-6-phosphate isomerase